MVCRACAALHCFVKALCANVLASVAAVLHSQGTASATAQAMVPLTTQVVAPSCLIRQPLGKCAMHCQVCMTRHIVQMFERQSVGAGQWTIKLLDTRIVPAPNTCSTLADLMAMALEGKYEHIIAMHE